MTRLMDSRHINNLVKIGFAMIVGAAIFYVSKSTSSTTDPQSSIVFFGWLASTFIACFLFGLMLNKQAWIWGISILAGQIILISITESGDMTQFPIGVVLYMALVIPAVLFSALGGYVSKKWRSK